MFVGEGGGPAVVDGDPVIAGGDADRFEPAFSIEDFEGDIASGVDENPVFFSAGH
jgi:hypothetical protein